MPLHPRLQFILDTKDEIAKNKEQFMQLGLPAIRKMVDERLSNRWLLDKADVDRVEDLQIEGPHGDIRLRIYSNSSSEKLPCLVYAHGGAWWLGSLENVDSHCKYIAAEAGCVVVSVGYRLAPEFKFPVQIEECYRVLEWCAEHADDLNIAADRIAIGGRSAGANVAASVCLMARDRGGPKILFQTLEAPPLDARMGSESYRKCGNDYMLTSDDMRQAYRYYLDVESQKYDPLVSPVLAEDLSGLPPAYIVTLEFDPLRDEAEHYGRRLQEAGVACMIRRYDGLIHEYGAYEKEIPEISEIRRSLVRQIRNFFSEL